MAKPRLVDIASAIGSASLPAQMRTRLVGIDGCGGSGKSTLADALGSYLPGCTIIRTDDFAAWDNPIDWWPRLLDQVLRPLQSNRPGRYQRYDWGRRDLAEWHDVPVGGTVLIEGVTAIRPEFRPALAFAIYVDTPRELRLRRGLRRDGADALAQWRDWMKAEDAYVASQAPQLHADLCVSGVIPYQ